MMKHARHLLSMLLAASLGLQSATAEENLRVVSSQADLRDILREAQWLMLPHKGGVEMEGGRYWFAPENAEAEQFVWTLLRGQGLDARVRVSEDAVTRETVLEDFDGVEIERLQAEEDYQPNWVLELLVPGDMNEGWMAEDYDPSQVSVSLRLVPVFWELGETQEGGAVVPKPPDVALEGPVSTALPGVASEDKAVLPNPPDAGRFLALLLSARTNDVALSVELAPRIVYVDATRGDDAWTGRQRVLTRAGEGPKRSVAAGLLAVQEGGGLVIQEGVYAETLDVRGRNVMVRFDGDVVLKPAVRDTLGVQGSRPANFDVRAMFPTPTHNEVNVNQ